MSVGVLEVQDSGAVFSRILVTYIALWCVIWFYLAKAASRYHAGPPTAQMFRKAVQRDVPAGLDISQEDATCRSVVSTITLWCCIMSPYLYKSVRRNKFKIEAHTSHYMRKAWPECRTLHYLCSFVLVGDNYCMWHTKYGTLFTNY